MSSKQAYPFMFVLGLSPIGPVSSTPRFVSGMEPNIESRALKHKTDDQNDKTLQQVNHDSSNLGYLADAICRLSNAERLRLRDRTQVTASSRKPDIFSSNLECDRNLAVLTSNDDRIPTLTERHNSSGVKTCATNERVPSCDNEPVKLADVDDTCTKQIHEMYANEIGKILSNKQILFFINSPSPKSFIGENSHTQFEQNVSRLDCINATLASLNQQVSSFNLFKAELSERGSIVQNENERLVKEYNSMEQQLAVYIRDKHYFENEAVRLTQQLESVNSELLLKESELKDKIEVLESLKLEFDVNQASFSELAADYEGQKFMLDQLCGEKCDLASKNDKLNTTCEALENERTNLESIVRKLQDDLHKKSVENSILESDISELREKNVELSSLASTIVDLQSGLSSKDSQLANSESLNADLMAQLSEKNAKLADFEIRETALQSELCAKNNELERFETMTSDLKADLREKQVAFDTLNFEHSEMVAKLDESLKQIDRFQDEICNLNGSIEALQEKLKKVPREHGGTQTERSAAGQKIQHSKVAVYNGVEDQVIHLIVQNAISDAVSDRKTEHIQKLESSLNENEVQHSEVCKKLQEKLKIASETVSNLNEENNKLRVEKTEICNEVISLKDKMELCVKEIEIKSENLRKMEKSYQHLSDEKLQLQAKFDQVCDENCELKVKIDEIESEKMYYAHENAVLNSEISELKQDLAQMNDSLTCLKQEKEKLMFDCQTVNENYSSVKSKAEISENEYAILKSEKELLYQQFQASNDRIIELEYSCSSLRDGLAEKCKDIDQMKLNEVSLKSEIDVIKCDLQNGWENLECLKVEKRGLEDQVKDMNVEVIKAEDLLDGTRSELELCKQELFDAQNARETTKAEIEQLQKDKELLNDNLVETENQLEQQKQDLSNALKSKQQNEAKAEQLQKEKELLNVKLLQSESESQELSDLKVTYTLEREELNGKVEMLNRKIEHLELSMSEARAASEEDRNELCSANRLLQEKLASTEMEKSSTEEILKSEIRQKCNELEEVRGLCNKTEDLIAQLNIEAAGNQDTVWLLEQEKVSINEKVTLLVSENEKLSLQIENLDAVVNLKDSELMKLQECEETLQLLKREREVNKEKITESEELVLDLQSANSNFKLELSKLHADNELLKHKCKLIAEKYLNNFDLVNEEEAIVDNLIHNLADLLQSKTAEIAVLKQEMERLTQINDSLVLESLDNSVNNVNGSSCLKPILENSLLKINITDLDQESPSGSLCNQELLSSTKVNDIECANIDSASSANSVINSIGLLAKRDEKVIDENDSYVTESLVLCESESSSTKLTAVPDFDLENKNENSRNEVAIPYLEQNLDLNWKQDDSARGTQSVAPIIMATKLSTPFVDEVVKKSPRKRLCADETCNREVLKLMSKFDQRMAEGSALCERRSREINEMNELVNMLQNDIKQLRNHK